MSQNKIDFSLVNDWGSGFNASMFIKNNGTSKLSNWTIEFNFPYEITQIWNAEIVSHKGDRYVVRNMSWNGEVASGGSVSFGFNGGPGNLKSEPSAYVLNGERLATPSLLPTLSIDDVTLTEGNAGVTLANFEVELSQASNKTVTIKYATNNGTADRSDYTATSGTLSFAPGETTKTISVRVIGDRLAEAREAFSLNLSNPTNAAIADAQGLATIIDNDSPQSNNGSPQQGTFNYGEALQKSFLFYEAQRSGPLPDDNRIEWRGDSALKDGAKVGVNLTGGYYDAGDHVKFGFPMAASMTLLGWGVVESRDAYQQSGQLDDALDAIKWGTDYILKAHITDAQGTKEFWGQVGRGGTDHAYWGAPEAMTMERPAFKIDRQHPGSDLAGEAAAALAAASIAFRPTDRNYADRLLQNAEQLFKFADTYRGKYSDAITDAAAFYNSWSGYNDELVWAATWLHKATEAKGSTNTSYLNKAEQYYQGVNQGWTHNWDNKSQGAAILLAQETNKTRYRQDVEGWLDNWSNKNGGGIKDTAGGLAWLDQWGSLRYSANTAFLAGIYSDTVKDYGDRYSNFAQEQIDYILGDNPKNFSYLVGFGDNFPDNPHHRAASGTNNISDPKDNRHVLYGALVGGPSAPNDNAYSDDRQNYITNEVALDYNAGLTGALARMYDSFGGDPLSNSELNSLPGIVTDPA